PPAPCVMLCGPRRVQMHKTHWRRLIEESLDLHLRSTESHVAEVERKLRTAAGGELHHLAAWARRVGQALAAGTTDEVPAWNKADPAWVARIKLQVQRALSGARPWMGERMFGKALEDHAARWEATARE